MADLMSIPIRGTVAADTFEPLLPPEEINNSLVEEWRAYLTDCLKNNFSVAATLSIADSGGTVLWIPQHVEETPHSRLALLHEFAKNCLKDFVRVFTGRRPGII